MTTFRLKHAYFGLACILLAGAQLALGQDDLEFEAVSEAKPAQPQATPSQKSGAKGDPLIEAFDGTLFFFTGVPGHIYNLASDADVFQISAMVKEANNAKHISSNKNGTYMQAIQVNTLGGKVYVETFSDDSAKMIVKINGEDFLMDASGNAKTEVLLKDGSKMLVDWSLWLAPHGTTITITTDAISAGIYLVPPGLDLHNMWQPSYLNLNLTLLQQPRGDLQGIIGDTYHYKSRETAGTADTNEKDAPVTSFVNDVYPVYPDFAYELSSHDSTPRYTFTHHFTNHLIQMRKEAASKKQELLLNPVSSA